MMYVGVTTYKINILTSKSKDMGIMDGDWSHRFRLDDCCISTGLRTRLRGRDLGHWQLHLLPLSNQLRGSDDLNIKPRCTGSHGYLLRSSRSSWMLCQMFYFSRRTLFVGFCTHLFCIHFAAWWCFFLGTFFMFFLSLDAWGDDISWPDLKASHEGIMGCIPYQ